MNRAQASNPSLFTEFMRLEGQDALKFGFAVIAKNPLSRAACNQMN